MVYIKKILEKIEELETFLECDLYSKFRPEEKINGWVWKRTDPFKSEEEFVDYLREHFRILEKEIKKLDR